jgi:hypothetical protein
MFKQILLAAVIFASADAMAGRPKIGVGTAAKKDTAPLFGPSAAKASGVTQFSASIPFQAQPEKLDGTMLGDIGFDPLGLSNLWDLNWLRAAEIKHGRVGMLASLGFLTQVTAIATSQSAHSLPVPACWQTACCLPACCLSVACLLPACCLPVACLLPACLLPACCLPACCLHVCCLLPVC